MIDTLLVILIIVCCVLISSVILKEFRQRSQEEEIRRIALKLAETMPVRESEVKPENRGATKEKEPEEYHSPIDFESLKKINPDIVAWLEVPGTVISYPVVQAKDNETYLKRDFEGGESAAGAIFLDCDSDADLMGFHSILYGHHMKNQTMFAQIVKFKEEDFFRKNREVILYTPDKEIRLKTVAAVYGDAGGEKRRTQFDSQKMLARYMDEMTKNCSFRQLPPGEITGLYSFVTCSYEFEDARTILYAVRETQEDSEAEGME